VFAFITGSDDSPCLFYVILAGKQCGIAGHRISKDTLVGIDFVGMPAIYRGSIPRVRQTLQVPGKKAFE
jgi:hypothetical protein